MALLTSPVHISAHALCTRMLVHGGSAGTAYLTTQVLSLIHKRMDRHELIAILGAMRMSNLRLGKDQDTGRLYVNKRSSPPPCAEGRWPGCRSVIGYGSHLFGHVECIIAVFRLQQLKCENN